MKRIVALLLASLVLLFSSMPAFAEADYAEIIDRDIEITDEEILLLEHVTGIYDSSAIRSRASGLIVAKKLSLAKSGNELIISASTSGSTDVKKSGFTYVRLQRYVNGSWQNYASYVDQYRNAASHSFSKAVTAVKGYSYRVVCEHYAEKPYLLVFKSTEKIYNVTTSLSF